MSFSQSTKDKINGWGSVLSFITPVLLTITLFILTGIKGEIRDVKLEAGKRFDKIDLQFSNHLEHHRIFEIAFCERLTAIETKTRN
jgi:hypothetical protein